MTIELNHTIVPARDKVAAAKFFARTVLPRLSTDRAIAEATDNELMDLDESAF
jgi:hypothetical protein